MRKFTDDYRLQADSLPEIVRELEHVRAMMQGVRIRGRKITVGPILNAIVVAFLDLPAEEQRRRVIAGAAHADALLAAEDDGLKAWEKWQAEAKPGPGAKTTDSAPAPAMPRAEGSEEPSELRPKPARPRKRQV